MRPLRIGVVELLTHSPLTPWFRRKVVAPQTASVMPQAVAVWAERRGHSVCFETWTGAEALLELLPAGLDLVFVSAFTRAAFAAYALSAHLRARGVVTVLGGPHARSFPEHARDHFDYVVGQCDEALIGDLLAQPARQRPGVLLEAARPPDELPSVAERERFIDQTLRKGLPGFRVVPMLGSLGCPYTCDFCVDAPVPYRPLSEAQVRDDLRHVQRRWGAGTFIGWHDPNFGVRRAAYFGAIDEAGVDLRHIGEMSLSLLDEETLRRLRAQRFVALGPGIESWFGYAPKSGGRASGLDKVAEVAEVLNRLRGAVPHVQANFILGLDGDAHDETWELHQEFLRRAPGVFPLYLLATNFYNAPLSVQLHRQHQTLAVPFPLLDNNAFGNTRPPGGAEAFYARLVRHFQSTWSWRRLASRVRHAGSARALMLGRGLDEGRGWITVHRRTLAALRADRDLAAFYAEDRRPPPAFFMNEVRRQLGPLVPAVPAELLDARRFAEGFWRAADRAVERVAPAGAGKGARLVRISAAAP